MVRTIVSILAVVALSGCRLHVISLQGGQVNSSSSGNCLEQTSCVHNINDTAYTESFTAVPTDGYHFVKWANGDNFMCANSTSQRCVIDTTGAAGIIPDAVIAALGDYYIMPIFSDNVPITDTIIVDGKEWAQVELFINLSWNDIDAVCPADNDGICDGNLVGWNVTGWTWAHLSDVNELFNTYLDPVVLGPFSPDSYVEEDSLWAPAFYADGWRPVPQSSYDRIRGWTRIEADSTRAFTAYLYTGPEAVTEFGGDVAGTDKIYQKNVPYLIGTGHVGAWFYRTP